MRRIYLLVVFIGAGCLMAGCNKQSGEASDGTTVVSSNDVSATASNTWQSAKETGSNAWEEVKSASTNAWDGAKDAGTNAWQKTKDAFAGGVSTDTDSTNYFAYDYSMKDTFLSEARTNLADLDQNFLNLSNRLATASDSTKADLQQTLQEISAKRADLQGKYDEIQNATQDNWNDTKAAFAKSYHDLKADLKAGWDSVTSRL